ncbi:hypothetical protein Mapa_016209 [Marchantia paleacea]|nr:hypothetical protein Mapa_016209 [Marchantia paleacea]
MVMITIRISQSLTGTSVCHVHSQHRSDIEGTGRNVDTGVSELKISKLTCALRFAPHYTKALRYRGGGLSSACPYRCKGSRYPYLLRERRC